MTTLLLNETLVKFPLLSDGSERNSLSLILSKLASVMYTAQMRLSLSLTRPFHSSHSRWLAHFYYYRESQTIHFIYSHTYIFNINISSTGSRQESQIRHFTLLSLPFRAPHCGTHHSVPLVGLAKKSIKNLNTTEFQAFRIVKIFQWVI